MSDLEHVKSVFFVNRDQECNVDCTNEKELVEVCEIVESAECAMDFFNDEFVDIFESQYDEELYNLAEDVEKKMLQTLQIGRGLKRTADDLIQIDVKRRRLSEPSTSGDSGLLLQPPASDLDFDMVECEVNAAFEELRIRARAGSGRLPKLEILRAAIQHIERLQAALRAAAVLETETYKGYIEPPAPTSREVARELKPDKEKPFMSNETSSCGANSLARLRCIVQALSVKDHTP